MQVMVNVPDEIYQKIQSDEFWLSCGLNLSDAYDSIKNGIPLPKGHGRLIDADELDRKMKAYNSGRGFYYSGLPYVHTIIGADKAEMEE